MTALPGPGGPATPHSTDELGRGQSAAARPRGRLLALALALLVIYVSGGIFVGLLGLTRLLHVVAATVATTAPDPSAERPASLGTDLHTVVDSFRPRPAPPRAAPAAWFLYAAGGDLWETNGVETYQLTDDGQLTQPALADDLLVWVKRARNASDLWAAGPAMLPHPLTHNAAAIVAANHWVAQPTLLPDGSGLYMLADLNKEAAGVGDLAIWQLDLPDGHVRQITHPQPYTGGDQDIAVDPQEPNTLVFTRYRYTDSGDLVEGLARLRVDAQQAVPLTAAEHPARQASVAPDGVTLAFVQTDGREENLYVGRIATTDAPRLTDLQQVATGTIAQPAWSPDGTQLAYLALTDRRFQLWVRSLTEGDDGAFVLGPPRQITRGDGLDATARPVWITNSAAAEVRQWLQAVRS